MPPTRRTRQEPFPQPHAEIPTPSWRPFVSSAPTNSAELDISDDDTSDEAYIIRHQPLALEERARWAGPAAAQNPAAIVDSQLSLPRRRSPVASKTTTKPIKPLFPTPLECFRMVRRARDLHARQRAPRKRERLAAPARRAALRKFEPPLQALAAVESVITKERAKLRRYCAKLRKSPSPSLPAVARPNRLSHTRHPIPPTPTSHAPSAPSFISSAHDAYTHPQLHSPAVERVTFKLASAPGRRYSTTNPSVSVDPTTPPPLDIANPSTPLSPSRCTPLVPADTIVPMLVDRVLAEVDDMETAFRERTAHLLQLLKNVALQAQCSLSRPVSFATMRRDVAVARKVDEERQEASASLEEIGNEVPLSEYIRREIDPELYPLLSRTFRLNPMYRLDGTKVTDDSGQNGNTYGADMPGDDYETTNGDTNGLDSFGVDLDSLLYKDPQQNASLDHRTADDFERADIKSEAQAVNESMDFEPITFSSEVRKSKVKGRSFRRRKLARVHREKKERRSFRILENKTDPIPSDPSDASDPSPQSSYVHRAEAMSHAIDQPAVGLQPVVNLEADEELESDLEPQLELEPELEPGMPVVVLDPPVQ